MASFAFFSTETVKHISEIYLYQFIETGCISLREMPAPHLMGQLILRGESYQRLPVLMIQGIHRLHQLPVLRVGVEEERGLVLVGIDKIQQDHPRSFIMLARTEDALQSGNGEAGQLERGGGGKG